MQAVSRFLSVSLFSLLTFFSVTQGPLLAQGVGGEGGSAPPSFSVNPSAFTLQRGSGGQQQNNTVSNTAVPQAFPVPTPPTITFTQNTDTSTITSGNSVSCNSGGLHTNNSYYRRFDLDGAHGLTNVFSIGSVDIGIETAAGSTGSQPLEVRLYSIANGDPLLLANLNLIGSASFSQPNATLTVQNFPVTGIVDPLSDDLVVELFTPNGQTANNSFFIGSNNLGQSAPSYIMAADCGVSEPTDIAAVGFPGMHIVMIVNSGIPLYTLDVTLAGKGKGTVTSNPAGIDCGTDCDEVYADGTAVTLIAAPDQGSKFKEWTGDADCEDGTVTLTGNVACTATFTRFPWPMFIPEISNSQP